jgi:NAD(P)-dependent dehydrogenase (short-subunit alcohol dehydrogenase family)
MNILITGASRGIGLEVAKILSHKHKIIAIARSIGKVEVPGVISIPFDLEKGNIRQELFPQIQKHFDTVDVLVNNAAMFVKKPFYKLTQEDFQKIFHVNVFAVAELTQVILSIMKRGHVLNIASMGGVQGSMKFPGLAAYSASKGALITLTECLAEEYKNKNMVFNAIALGAVQTAMLAEAFPGFKSPLSATEAAEFIAYFAVNGSKYFNGKIIPMAINTP